MSDGIIATSVTEALDLIMYDWRLLCGLKSSFQFNGVGNKWGERSFDIICAYIARTMRHGPIAYGALGEVMRPEGAIGISPSDRMRYFWDDRIRRFPPSICGIDKTRVPVKVNPADTPRGEDP
ncbi:Hypothetical protein NTJ_05715 [Nesidiocoris tenuis]|uniref:Peptidase C1A papain C-terminal domain-containing protein n=1 Tax=Nesidiocoris tenuis TaxID=355587 RepID=A0ABN7AL00_9HEMI|nr:Hypothetical protein NTJ_05715 [Nesidiocoris tenuis]